MVRVSGLPLDRYLKHIPTAGH